MKYSQVVLIAIGGVALGVSATPTAAPRQGFPLRKAGETLETVAEGVNGGIGRGAVSSTVNTPYGVHQGHQAFRKNLYTQHSPSESTAQVLQTPQPPTEKSAKGEHWKKKNRERSAGEQRHCSSSAIETMLTTHTVHLDARVPTAARAFDEELFARNNLKALRAGGRAATRAAGGTEGLGSSLGGIYGAYKKHKEAKAQAQAQTQTQEARRWVADEEDLYARNSPLLRPLRDAFQKKLQEALAAKAGKAGGKSRLSSDPHLDDETEARDLEDEVLEARSLVDAWKALWKPQSKEEKAKKLQEDARIAAEKAAAATAALDERDSFEMEDDLATRDFAYEMDELD